MKRVSFFIWLILGTLTVLMAQVPVQNGSFESWTQTDLLVSFPPYESITNLASIGEGQDQNVYPVNIPGGGQAVKLAPNIVDGDTLVAAMGIGEFFPDKAGAAFSGTPDSFKVALRYHIQPNDNGLIAFNFFAGGTKIMGPVLHFFTGTDSIWHEEAFDLPPFPGSADSIGVLIAGGDFNNSQVGTWLEIDSMYFTGNADPIPNGQFDQTDSLSYSDPDEWLTPNLFSALFMVDPSVTRTATASHGSYAVRIETVETETNDGTDTASWLFLAQEIADIGPSGGIQVPTGAETPLALTGDYQYHPIGLDTAIAYLVMTAFDPVTQTRDTLAMIAHLLPPASGFQQFRIPLDFTEEADSFIMAFAASDVGGDFHTGTTGIGSVLVLDNLTFDTTMVANSLVEPFSSLQTRMYPNPATTQITLAVDDSDHHPCEIRIFQQNGQLLHQETWTPTISGQKVIDLHKFPHGILLVEVISPSQQKRWSSPLLHQ